jgi:glycerol kinase
MQYLLALDQGTTSSRSLIIDKGGHIVSIAQREFQQHFPASGWVEHDPEEIWSSQFSVANEAMAKAKISPKDLAAIGITNQRETTILWNRKTSKPIAMAIVWQDRRTTPLCEHLRKQGLEPLFMQKTGLLLDPYFSGTKISWLLDHVNGARKMAEKGELAFGTVDSWLIWQLTKGKIHATDATNASRTLLYNIHTLQWDDELLKILDIPRSILPEVRSCSEIYGQTANHVFSMPIPIAGIAGDQQAALFGQACFNAGMAKGTYGTGCFILMNTGNKAVISKNKLLTTIALQMNGETHYALEGSVFNAGTAIQWFRDNLGLIKKSSDIDTLAGTVPDSGGVFFVPAFTGLGAPHWDPYARGTILGISRGTTGAHVARAILESIAFQAADVLRAMESDAGLSLTELRVDGGIVASDLTMQFQADLMQIPVMRPKNQELTALGAAFLAGLAVKVWPNPREIAATWQLEREFRPAMDDLKRRKLLEKWDRAIACAKGWEG